MEGSGAGSVLVTNGSRCGSWRPNTLRILRNRIRSTASRYILFCIILHHTYVDYKVYKNVPQCFWQFNSTFYVWEFFPGWHQRGAPGWSDLCPLMVHKWRGVPIPPLPPPPHTFLHLTTALLILHHPVDSVHIHMYSSSLYALLNTLTLAPPQSGALRKCPDPPWLQGIRARESEGQERKVLWQNVASHNVYVT
jgi:hypothetical protein